MQIVILEEDINQEIGQGHDLSTLKLLYSVSDKEQDQSFSSKGAQFERLEQNGVGFYKASFNEKFTFTLSETESTDSLDIKIFTRIATFPNSSD